MGLARVARWGIAMRLAQYRNLAPLARQSGYSLPNKERVFLLSFSFFFLSFFPSALLPKTSIVDGFTLSLFTFKLYISWFLKKVIL
jgi:hypothetical protein